MGPSYSLQREVHIPEGSMSIPDLDEVQVRPPVPTSVPCALRELQGVGSEVCGAAGAPQESVVVLDRTTSVGRVLTAASFTAALLGTWTLAVPP